MSIPLSFLLNLPPPPINVSLGEQLAQALADSRNVNTLLDCLCITNTPALLSPDLNASRPPLTHAALRHFMANFILPTSGLRKRLGPNDRVMVVLPTGPENAVAILAVAAYHTCAPVNAECTLGELAEDARRLHVKAILTTPDVSGRLGLGRSRNKLHCDILFVQPRTHGPVGLFDVSPMEDPDDWVVVPSPHLLPSRLHVLGDQSLVLHTSGTSGKKKVCFTPFMQSPSPDSLACRLSLILYGL